MTRSRPPTAGTGQDIEIEHGADGTAIVLVNVAVVGINHEPNYVGWSCLPK